MCFVVCLVCGGVVFYLMSQNSEETLNVPHLAIHEKAT